MWLLVGKMNKYCEWSDTKTCSTFLGFFSVWCHCVQFLWNQIRWNKQWVQWLFKSFMTNSFNISCVVVSFYNSSLKSDTNKQWTVWDYPFTKCKNLLHHLRWSHCIPFHWNLISNSEAQHQHHGHFLLTKLHPRFQLHLVSFSPNPATLSSSISLSVEFWGQALFPVGTSSVMIS